MDGANIVDAFENCSSARSLVMGSFIALVITFLFYIPRKVISFNDFCGCFVTGFKAMTSAVMILCLAEMLCVFQKRRRKLRGKRFIQNRVNPYAHPPNGGARRNRPLPWNPPRSAYHPTGICPVTLLRHTAAGYRKCYDNCTPMARRFLPPHP